MTRININKEKNHPSFKGNKDFGLRVAKKYLNYQENVAGNRFIQDTATNWLPSAVLTRSAADLGDKTFLEFIESAIFYFLPTIFGNALKKSYSKFHPQAFKNTIDKSISKSAESILADKELQKSEAGKRALSTKAAIILGCTVIPAAEYALSFAKNLFTLKVFKKSDFNNIANLNKEQKEDKRQQEHVEKSAKKSLRNAGLLSLGGLVASIVFAKFGHKSSALQKASDLILQPGANIAKGLRKLNLIKENGGAEKFLKKYITPDFNGINEKGKFKLSQGQLLITTVSGFFGYSAAAKDRGKLDQYEVWTRVPFVVLYTVFGSALFDKAFNHIFIKKNIFSDIVTKGKNGISIAETKDLPTIAEKIATAKNSTKEAELNKLIKQKAIVKSIPYLFGIVFMGFFLSGITRFWTQRRYDKGHKVQEPTQKTTRQYHKQKEGRFTPLIKFQSIEKWLNV